MNDNACGDRMVDVEDDELLVTQGGARECEQTTLGLMCRESKNDIWKLQ